jgi:hypothetical protein
VVGGLVSVDDCGWRCRPRMTVCSSPFSVAVVALNAATWFRCRITSCCATEFEVLKRRISIVVSALVAGALTFFGFVFVLTRIPDNRVSQTIGCSTGLHV